MQQLLRLTFTALHNLLCGFEELRNNSIGMQGQSCPSNPLSDIKYTKGYTHTLVCLGLLLI